MSSSPVPSFRLDPDATYEIRCPDCAGIVTVAGRFTFPSDSNTGTDLGHDPVLGDLTDAAGAHECKAEYT